MRAAAMGIGLLLIILLAPTSPAAAGGRQGIVRPLHLPQLEHGAPCPVSPVDERVDWPRLGLFGGSGTGRGPIYPMIGASTPVGQIQTTPGKGPWFRTKVLWYSKPNYRRPAIVRGARLDGPGMLRFTSSRTG